MNSKAKWARTEDDVWAARGFGHVSRKEVLRADGRVTRYIPFDEGLTQLNAGYTTLKDAQAHVEANAQRKSIGWTLRSAELESLFDLADTANDLARDAWRWERGGSEDGRGAERLARLHQQLHELKNLLRTAWNAAREAEQGDPT